MIRKYYIRAQLLCACLAGLALLPEATFAGQEVAFSALAAMAHLPALVRVAAHGKLLRARLPFADNYPEIVVIAGILMVWLIGGVAFSADTSYWLLAGASVASLCAGYAGVRLVVHINRKLQEDVCQSATQTDFGVSDTSARVIFCIRQALAVLSLGMLIWTSTIGPVPVTFVAPILLAIGAVVAAVLLSWRFDKLFTKSLSANAKETLARALKSKPTSIAIYHAGSGKSQIAATKDLCMQLLDEGLEFVLIVREKKARRAFAGVGAQHLWHAETLAALGHCVQDSLHTVLYAHDTPKNSHFTRNGQYKHVLFAGFGELSTLRVLPKTVAIYDQIVAPNDTQADLWRATGSHVTKPRISTLKTAFARPKRLIGKHPILSVHAAPRFANANRTGTQFSEIELKKLCEAAAGIGQVQLQIWFPAVADAASDPALRAQYHALSTIGAVSAGHNPDGTLLDSCVTLHHGTEADAANAADILIAGQENTFDALLSTGKPLLWASTERAPEGALAWDLSTDGLTEKLNSILGTPATPHRARPSASNHFHSFRDFCQTTAAMPKIAQAAA